MNLGKQSLLTERQGGTVKISDRQQGILLWGLSKAPEHTAIFRATSVTRRMDCVFEVT